MSAPGSQVVTGSTDADRSLPARQAGDTPLVQAAQLSDEASRNCALAGGANPPGPQSRPRRRRRPLSNKLEFRTDPATADVIEALADKAGLTRSEAMRRLILAGAGQPQLFISPRNPPEQLETLLGALVRFRGDLRDIRSRLNAPLADPKSDPDLAMLTRDWRARSLSLFNETGRIIQLLGYATNAMLTLKPDHIPLLQNSKRLLKTWIEHAMTIHATDSDPNRAASYKQRAEILTAMMLLIESLGLPES